MCVYFEDSSLLEYWTMLTGQQLPCFKERVFRLLDHEYVGTMIL